MLEVRRISQGFLVVSAEAVVLTVWRIAIVYFKLSEAFNPRIETVDNALIMSFAENAVYKAAMVALVGLAVILLLIRTLGVSIERSSSIILPTVSMSAILFGLHLATSGKALREWAFTTSGIELLVAIGLVVVTGVFLEVTR